VQSVRLIAAIITAATAALAGCASSGHKTALGGDSQLVGTWRVSEAKEGSQTTRADGVTYEYLVFTRRGAFTRFGEMTEKANWTTDGGDLVLRYPDGESSGASIVRSEASGRISMAYGDLETSEQISYQVTASRLTLSGLSRSYTCTGDCLLHPTEGPSTPPPLTPVRITYVRVEGPPPPAPPGLPTTPRETSASSPGQPCYTCTGSATPTRRP
jgi:hypothetical protein